MDARLMLLDTAGLYFRSYYALPESLTADDGTPVNAARGFADMLARLLTDHRPTRLVACLDADWRPQFRVDALPSYKTHRLAEEPAAGEEAVPDTLTPQIPIILELLKACGLATGEADGYEADDVIGTLAASSTDPVQVITGDRDLFQVVRTKPPVRVLYIGAGLNKAPDYGPAELAQRYHLPAEHAGSAYADMAVLRGDPSDGLPGVAGIGEKTAAKLINQFGTLPALLAAANDSSDRRITAGQRRKIHAAADYLAAAPRVVRVVTDAPVLLDRDDTLPSVPAEPDRVAELQQRWNLGSPVDRLTRALRTS